MFEKVEPECWNKKTPKTGKVLRNKMAEVFSEEIKALPVEMRYILLDDLVTAFENRLSIFSQSKIETASGRLRVGRRQRRSHSLSP